MRLPHESRQTAVVDGDTNRAGAISQGRLTQEVLSEWSLDGRMGFCHNGGEEMVRESTAFQTGT